MRLVFQSQKGAIVLHLEICLDLRLFLDSNFIDIIFVLRACYCFSRRLTILQIAEQELRRDVGSIWRAIMIICIY